MRFAVFTLLAVIYSCSAMAAPDRATYPEQEPNDDCGQGQTVNFGDVIDPGCIDQIADHDWYTFEAYADDWISIATDESDGQPTVDTYITLYAEDCATVLVYDDDSGPGAYSLIIDFVAPYSGIYHLKVQSYGDYYTGCYQCSFDVAPPPPLGACCLPTGACLLVNEYYCFDQYGSEHWIPDGVCNPNPCPQPPLGPCCFRDGTCQILIEIECSESSGIWYGEVAESCDPNPCTTISVPETSGTIETSWGRIRATYR